MAITLRSPREIASMSKAGAVVAEVLSKLKELAGPGVTTAELNRVAVKMIAKARAEALFMGVKSPYAAMPFPAVICTSVNEQIVHGIPSEEVVLKNGDVLSLDFGAKLNGYCADAALTVGIGEVSSENRRLMQVTREVLDVAIKWSRPGALWSQVAARMQRHAESAGFSVVRDFVGHGIGREMHEEPKVPNFVSDELLSSDILLKEGMVLAVEPMINAGTYETATLEDGWTVVTRDGKCSAHFEHTIVIVEDGCKVLTA